MEEKYGAIGNNRWSYHQKDRMSRETHPGILQDDFLSIPSLPPSTDRQPGAFGKPKHNLSIEHVYKYDYTLEKLGNTYVGQEMDPSGQEMALPGQEMDPFEQEMVLPGQEMDPFGWEVVLPGQEINPFRKETVLHGKEMEQFRQEMVPPGQEMDQLGQEMVLPGQEMDPFGKEMEKCGQEMVLSGKEMDPFEQEVALPGQEINPIEQELALPRQKVDLSGLRHTTGHTRSTGKKFNRVGKKVKQVELILEQNEQPVHTTRQHVSQPVQRAGQNFWKVKQVTGQAGFPVPLIAEKQLAATSEVDTPGPTQLERRYLCRDIPCGIPPEPPQSPPNWGSQPESLQSPLNVQLPTMDQLLICSNRRGEALHDESSELLPSLHLPVGREVEVKRRPYGLDELYAARNIPSVAGKYNSVLESLRRNFPSCLEYP